MRYRSVDELADAARRDLDLLKHPDRRWLPDTDRPDGSEVADVILVGGGQSGVIAAASLMREGVDKVLVLDRAPESSEGPWSTFARMDELRTPKALVGSELGVPNLSVRRWFETTHGSEAWDAIERIPTLDWKAYLDWFADTVGVPRENGVDVTDIEDGPDGTVCVKTVTEGKPRTRFARTVVLATGFDGAGAWRVPTFVSDGLPPERYDHSNQLIDFSALSGKRIGVLGHGASAFDNARAALRDGAASVDLCFRRDRLPRVNPHRHIETAGLMTHYPKLPDRDRWAIARHFKVADQPPPVPTFEQAMATPGFRLRPATPWLAVEENPAGAIAVATPGGTIEFDHLILATGAVIDIESRPELSALAPIVKRWRHSIESSPADDQALSNLPYLGHGYAFEPLGEPNEAEESSWVRKVFAFNALSFVSQGPHSTSISGHRHAMPRLVRGVTERLFVDSCHTVVADLHAFRSEDLPVSDDFEELIGKTNRQTLQQQVPT